MHITSFLFSYKDSDGAHQYFTPQEAINDFNKRGYGMDNWTITVAFAEQSKKDPRFDTHKYTEISLIMFNYLTDNWNKLNSSEGV
jgi:hypothetical protein